MTTESLINKKTFRDEQGNILEISFRRFSNKKYDVDLKINGTPFRNAVFSSRKTGALYWESLENILKKEKEHA